MALPFEVVEHEIEGQHIRHYAASTLEPNIPLRLHVKQYIPKDRPNPKHGALTILAAHSSGFTKELYEPLFADLLTRYDAESSPGIRAIWMADTTNMGYSSTLNAANLGNRTHASDHARDLLHLTNVFRANMPAPIVALGHSLGAVSVTFLANMHPSLLAGLVLIDSPISDLTTPNDDAFRKAMVTMKDFWPDRASAESFLRNSRFYKAWDRRALDALCKHELVPLPTTPYADQSRGWTLRTSKHQRIANTYPAGGSCQPECARAFRQLPLLVPPVLLLRPRQSTVTSLAAHKRVLGTIGIALNEGAGVDVTGEDGGNGGVAAGAVTSCEIDGGHYVPFEQPDSVADALTPWLLRIQSEWSAQREAWLSRWRARPAVERQQMEPSFAEGVMRLTWTAPREIKM